MKKRHTFRFKPDDNSLIKIYYLNQENQKEEKIGLVCNESYEGCCAVFRHPFPFCIGELKEIMVGQSQGIQGKIKWLKNIDRELIKVGFTITGKI